MKFSTEQEIKDKLVLIYKVPERVNTLEDYEIPELLSYIDEATDDMNVFGISSSLFVNDYYSELELDQVYKGNLYKFELDIYNGIRKAIIKVRDKAEKDAKNNTPGIEDISELNTPEAKKIFERAIEAGLISVDNGYNWTGKSKQQLAYFVEKTSLHLELRKGILDKDGNPTVSWKPFDILFNRKRIQSAKTDWMKVNTKFEPVGYQIVDKLFK